MQKMEHNKKIENSSIKNTSKSYSNNQIPI